MSPKSHALLVATTLPIVGTLVASAGEFESETESIEVRDCSVIIRVGGDVEPAVEPIGTDLTGGVTVGYISEDGRLSVAIGEDAIAIQGVSIGGPTGVAIGDLPPTPQEKDTLPADQ